MKNHHSWSINGVALNITSRDTDILNKQPFIDRLKIAIRLIFGKL